MATYKKLTDDQKAIEYTFDFKCKAEDKFKAPEIKSATEFETLYAERIAELNKGNPTPFHLSYQEDAFYYRAVGRVVEKDEKAGTCKIVCGRGILVWDHTINQVINRYGDGEVEKWAKQTAFTSYDDSLTRVATGKAATKVKVAEDASARKTAITFIQSMLRAGIDPLPHVAVMFGGDETEAQNLCRMVKETMEKN